MGVGGAAVLLGLTLLAAGASAPDVGAATAAATGSADALVHPLSRSEWRRMTAAGMTGRDCPLTRTNLRRLEVNYTDYSGQVRRGALVVRGDVAASAARIFTTLFERRFPIARMEPIEAFGGDDDASMRANNTSAYNCRRASQANSPSAASPHANGRAIDLNPLQNPWIDPRCHCWEPSAEFRKRTPGQGKILKGGVAWTAFTRAGWVWQDSRGTDYQHFDTGYPSRPLPHR